jgi:hypothetical protein
MSVSGKLRRYCKQINAALRFPCSRCLTLLMGYCRSIKRTRLRGVLTIDLQRRIMHYTSDAVLNW